jgi:hypothetical protein
MSAFGGKADINCRNIILHGRTRYRASRASIEGDAGRLHNLRADFSACSHAALFKKSWIATEAVLLK